jgi:chemotaxis protein methyltransferase CheR
MAETGLSRFDDYLSKIENDDQERIHFSRIATVTISSFFRDREVFDLLEKSVIPAIIKNKQGGQFKAWSIGCASGEEPYTLALLWKAGIEKIFPRIGLTVVASDIDEHLLERAREGKYKKTSLEEAPPEMLQDFFKISGEQFILDPAIRERVEFRRHDILNEDPFEEMDIVLCRNLAFTYFLKERQIDVLKKIHRSLNEQSCLMVGKKESLPLVHPPLFASVFPAGNIFQKFTKRPNP